MNLVWYRSEEKLHLCIQYWKQSETSDGETGGSSNYIFRLDDGFVAAYNNCVKSAKETFHLPTLKTISSESDVNHPINDQRPNPTLNNSHSA